MIDFPYIKDIIARKMKSQVTVNNKSGLNAEIPSAAYISMQHKIVNMLDPQSHHNPQPKRFFQCHTQYDPTMKHSHCETVYAKELFQWLFFELVHSLRIL